MALDTGDGHRRDALRAAKETEFLVRGRFHAHAAERQFQASGELLADGVEVRRDLRRFGDERGIYVNDARFVGGDQVHDAREDFRGTDAADGFVRVREMVADVPGGDRAEQRVGNRVDEDIRIGMAVETLIVRDLDAAEDQRSACDQRVYVVTDTGEDRGGHIRKSSGLGKQ